MNRRSPAAAILIALLASQAAAQFGQSSITGMVTYRNGEPANARIYVGREGKYRSVSSKFRAGRNIGYQLRDLQLGRYELLVTAPGAQPRRIWGVTVGSFDQKTLNLVMDRVPPDVELEYREEGAPNRDDVPRDWAGGWLEGRILTAEGYPAEGTVNLLRAGTLFHSQPMGTPTLPAYFETRTMVPGTVDLLFTPAPQAKLKPVRVEKIAVAQYSRTVLAPITVPAGLPTDPPAVLPLPERRVEPVRGFPRR